MPFPWGIGKLANLQRGSIPVYIGGGQWNAPPFTFYRSVSANYQITPDDVRLNFVLVEGGTYTVTLPNPNSTFGLVTIITTTGGLTINPYSAESFLRPDGSLVASETLANAYSYMTLANIGGSWVELVNTMRGVQFHDNHANLTNVSANQHHNQNHASAQHTDAIAWTGYTPTITATVGTLTTVSATGNYNLLGKTLFLRVEITITTNGTGATAIKCTMPASLVGMGDNILVGRENAVTGNMLQASLMNSEGFFLIRKYDNSYPGADGYVLVMTAAVEVQ